MNLYQIDRAIEECVDMETGEIVDLEKLEALSMERNQKIENIALFIKNLKADADAIKAEENTLAERRKVIENKVESLKKYLELNLNGEKFETARCKVMFRNSKKVEIDDDFLTWAMEHDSRFVRHKKPEVDKVALGHAFKAGENIPHAQYIDTQSMTVK